MGNISRGSPIALAFGCFTGRADNAKQNRQSKHKKGAYYHGKQPKQ
ncbi:hypothetical protein [Helicobacter pylori]